MPRAPCLHSWGWWSDCKEPSFSTATFICTQCYYYSWISFFLTFKFRASDKIAKCKKAGCSCETPGLLMRRPLSIPDLSGQHRTPLPLPPPAASRGHFGSNSYPSHLTPAVCHMQCVFCVLSFVWWFHCLLKSMIVPKLKVKDHWNWWTDMLRETLL